MLSTRVAIGLGLIWLFVAAAFAASEDGTLVFEQNFLLEKIGTSLLALPGAVKSALNGTLQKQPATTPKKVGQRPTEPSSGGSRHRFFDHYMIYALTRAYPTAVQSNAVQQAYPCLGRCC